MGAQSPMGGQQQIMGGQSGGQSYGYSSHSQAASGYQGGHQNGTMGGVSNNMGTLPANQALHVNTAGETRYASVGGQHSGSQG